MVQMFTFKWSLKTINWIILSCGSIGTKHEDRDFQLLHQQEVRHPVNGTRYPRSGLHFVWSRNCINISHGWSKQLCTGKWSTKVIETFFLINKNAINTAKLVILTYYSFFGVIQESIHISFKLSLWHRNLG